MPVAGIGRAASEIEERAEIGGGLERRAVHDRVELEPHAATVVLVGRDLFERGGRHVGTLGEGGGRALDLGHGGHGEQHDEGGHHEPRERPQADEAEDRGGGGADPVSDGPEDSGETMRHGGPAATPQRPTTPGRRAMRMRARTYAGTASSSCASA